MAKYDSSFFAYVNSGAVVSARRLIPFILQTKRISSVLDVGCGQGAWLSVWRELGVNDVVGIDGDYVDRDDLLIPEELFNPLDLSAQFELDRKFDLVQCLEVAEHLAENSAPKLVDSLCAHSSAILFSAAPPGQGGDHHINEQPYEYWRNLFALHGYVACDFIRPQVAHDFEIEPWYRFNVFLYVKEDSLLDLPDSIRITLVPPDVKLSDISPRIYQIRKAFVKTLPVAVMTRLAKAKERLIMKIRARNLTRD